MTAPQTLHDIFADATREHAAHPLFGVKQGGAWVWLSYSGFALQVNALRSGLAQIGVGWGDRVAIIANNRVEWAAASYACAGLGAQLVPMYVAQHPDERRYILSDCGARVVIAATPEIAAACEGLTVVLLEGQAPGTLSYSTLLARGERLPMPAAEVSPDEVAAILYTSGTTGKPKGVMLTHRNLVSNVTAMRECFPLGPGDRSLSFLPWAHAFGQTAELHTLMSMGAAIAIAESPQAILDNIAEVRPTILVSVPRIFNRIYDRLRHQADASGGVRARLLRMALANARRRREAPGLLPELLHAIYDRLVFRTVRERLGGRLRYAFSGGAALSPRVAAFVEDLGVVVYEGYGLTETGPVVATNRPAASRPGTVGLPLPGVRVEIDRDATGHSVDGEIVVYGANVMLGYLGLPGETDRILTADGGLRTGDIGRLDEDGFLSITGRIKEQYKLENGKYVAPAPLEEHLKLAPLVSSVLLFGDNRAYNVALVVPDWDAVGLWAARSGLGSDDLDALLDGPQLRAAIQQQLDAEAADFKHFERPRRLCLLREDFTTDNGMLTPSLKPRRRVILDRYAEQVEALYRAP